MATLNSTAISQSKPIPGEGAGGGQEKTQYCEVTIPVGTTTTDIINLFDLPRHARIIGCKISVDALGAGTLNVGDTGVYQADGTFTAANASRYFAAQSVASAGVFTSTSPAGIYFYTGQGNGANRSRMRVQASFAAGTTTSAGVLRCNFSYTVEEPQLP